MKHPQAKLSVAIACGGTGGHLFPGLAIAEELLHHNCEVTLLVSPKEVDQRVVKNVCGMEVVTLPAIGLRAGNPGEFIKCFWRSYKVSRTSFRDSPPRAVLAMGGFTSAPPILASKHFQAATFIHESNTIPGRANRWLSPWVDEAFVYFRETAPRLTNLSVSVTGMPVRFQFQPMDASTCRIALGLAPQRPTLLVMGGSQGAESINQLMIDAAPQLAAKVPTLQFLHLTGPEGMERVRRAYAAGQQKAVVQPFLTEMELALGAATVAVSRAGASSLAELAAMQLPAILIPYPTAADDHQFYNARAFAEAGAARMVGQKTVTPEILAELVTRLVSNEKEREHIRAVLRQRHVPDAAARIAERILNVIHERDAVAGKGIGSGSKTSIELEDTGLKEAPNQKSQPCMMSARPTMDTWNSK